MTTSEKVAYLKGLFEGMQFKAESNEAKLFNTIIGVLGDMAHDIEDLEENSLDLGEEIDELSDDLAVIEDILYGDDDFDDDEHGHCGCGCHDGEPLFFEVKCPACENEITIDEDVLELGTIQCPNCDETLEFYIGDDEGEESSEDSEEQRRRIASDEIK